MTLADPTIWTKPWTVVIRLKETQAPIYEYACLEERSTSVDVDLKLPAKDDDALWQRAKTHASALRKSFGATCASSLRRKCTRSWRPASTRNGCSTAVSSRSLSGRRRKES